MSAKFDSSTTALTTSPTTFRKGRSLNDRVGIGFLVVTFVAIILGLAIGIPLSKRDTSGGGASQSSELQRAMTLLTNNPLIDGHNDLPWQFRQYANNSVYSVNLEQDMRVTWNNETPYDDTSFPRIPSQTDIPRLRAGKVGGQFWAIFISCASVEKDAVRLGLDATDIIHKFVEKYDDFELATTAQGITEAFNRGKIASLLGLEGGHMIGNSLGALRMYYRLGVRYMTLTHSCDVVWADSVKADERTPPSTRGLSEFGEKVVLEMNRLGMIVDLSHTSEQTQKDALNVSRAPVIFSHSSVYSLCNHARNVKDEVLQLTKQNKGLVMINFYKHYIDCAPTNATGNVSHVADHIDYVKDLIGVDYVGIGADYDGVPVFVDGLEDVSKYPYVFEELIKRQWTNEDLIKLAGGNLLRVFREVEAVRNSMSNTHPFEDILDRNLRNENCTSGF
uniref:Dipeptidase n=1 Tax=Crassostrea virginica TaxID=6565 RepID=A0A8B8C3H2_CRAVI|nr:dipeptidase 1-like [Crassostrea virginica]